MDDLKFLKWLYERLISVHDEKPNVDYMIRFKNILIEMDVNNTINKKQAIEFIQVKFQGNWPNQTNGPSPEGWKWVISHKPYCIPEIILEHTGYDDHIYVSEVYK